MIAVKIGKLSPYSVSAKQGNEVLDAWWTNSSISLTTPVGDFVMMRPWVKVLPPMPIRRS
jgi:hypothetical protein